MKQVIINTIIGAADQLSQKEVVDQLVRLQSKVIDAIELRLELFSDQTVQREEELCHYLTIQNLVGWDYLLSVPDDFIVHDQVNEKFLSYIDFAERLNCRNIKMTIGNHQAVDHIDIPAVKDILSSANMTLTLENDQSDTTGNPKIVKKVLDQLDTRGLKTGLTFDIGNWYIAGESMQEAFELLKDDIRYLHIKNVYESLETSLFSDGIANVPYYMGNYPAIIEYAIPESQWQSEIQLVHEALFRED